MASAINFDDFKKEIFASAEFEAAAKKEAEQVLFQQKEILIQEFNQHVVTQEIEAGPTSSNKSNTLGGKGNLFSFIGFEDQSNPTEPVRELLREIKLGNLNKNLQNGNMQFKVDVPSREAFEAVSKMPWEAGRSWLFEVERAISGLSSYLYAQFKNSRSGTGLQSTHEISTGRTFTPIKYITTMLENFTRALNK